ncbi:MAG: cation:proton antiporter, partial [Bacteroidota bacterium]
SSDSLRPADEHAEAGHVDPVASVLIALSVILIAAKLGSELFERFGQPGVLGELALGVLLGNLVLINSDWNFFEALRVQPIVGTWPVVIDSLARLGVILLLFEVGLESSMGEMRKVGLSAFLVAMVGVIAPFILGFGVSWMFIEEVPASILAMAPNFDLTNIHMFVGATLTATSVGITARVLKDLRKLHVKEARIILGAAVMDDVLGLVILAVVAGIVVAAETGVPLEPVSLLKIIALAVGFLVGAIVIGQVLVPRAMKYIARLRTHGVMLISALIFCFLLSYLANAVGLATIVGAFAAGLILEEVHFANFRETRSLQGLLSPLTTILVPVFFIVMGIQVRLETFVQLEVLGIAVGLTVAAFIGKQVCGLAVVEKGLDRLSVGIGMVPRGEVGLIFASIGRGLGVVDDALFSAIIMMVMVTTLMTPPLLKWSLSRRARSMAPSG